MAASRFASATAHLGPIPEDMPDFMYAGLLDVFRNMSGQDLCDLIRDGSSMTRADGDRLLSFMTNKFIVNASRRPTLIEEIVLEMLRTRDTTIAECGHPYTFPLVPMTHKGGMAHRSRCISCGAIRWTVIQK